MTTAQEPRSRGGALGRGWRAFRRWRRGRPFWGGLFSILAGAEMLYLASPRIQEMFFLGAHGFLPYFITGMMALCGLLMWLAPGQRVFYGILTVVLSLASLLYVDIGGFLLGFILAMVGGSLAFAWTPAQSPAGPLATTEPGAAGRGPDDRGPVDDSTLLDEVFGEAPTAERPRYDPIHSAGGPVEPAGTPSPYAADNPYAADHPWAERAQNGSPYPDPSHTEQTSTPPPYTEPPYTEEPPDPRRGRRRAPGGTAFAILVVPALVAGLLIVDRSPASAAPPCPTPTASPSPTPSAGAGQQQQQKSGGGGVLGAIGDFFDSLFGNDKKAEAPTNDKKAEAPTNDKKAEAPTTDPSPAPSTTPGPTPTCPPAGGGTPGSGGTPGTGGKPGTGSQPGTVPAAPPKAVAAVPATDVPPIPAQTSKLTANVLTQYGLSFDGVAELKRVDGTVVRALKFSMDKAVNDTFQLLTPAQISGGGKPFTQQSRQLTVEGHVAFYATRFHGSLLGIPLTFTPDAPPPLVLPFMIFTGVEVDLAYVHGDKLTEKTFVKKFV